MTLKKKIQKPENWQDFESLCKKLWGEIWECQDSIKKNGRAGQPQCGVDIYAIPKGKDSYYGIQCKGKDDYVNSMLTENEIDAEINKAKQFIPKLKCFILATTANKDVKIEEYVRIRNIENIRNETFSLDIFSWEDIADLIDENRNTYNWYVRDLLHKSNYGFNIQLDSVQCIYRPKFEMGITKYKLKPKTKVAIDVISKNQNFSKDYLLNFNLNKYLYDERKQINHSWISPEITMTNSGTEVIEDWRVEFELVGNFYELKDNLDLSLINQVIHVQTTPISISNNKIVFRPHNNKPIVQNDSRSFSLYIKPFPEKYTLILNWQLIARDYSTSGMNEIHIDPDFVIKEFVIEVVNEKDLKEDKQTIVDFIERIK